MNLIKLCFITRVALVELVLITWHLARRLSSLVPLQKHRRPRSNSRRGAAPPPLRNIPDLLSSPIPTNSAQRSPPRRHEKLRRGCRTARHGAISAMQGRSRHRGTGADHRRRPQQGRAHGSAAGASVQGLQIWRASKK
jgi:hypothetical protein